MTQAVIQETFELREAMREFSNVTHDKYNGHSFACGYLESFAASMFMTLPKKRRAEFLADMKDAAERYKKLAEI